MTALMFTQIDKLLDQKVDSSPVNKLLAFAIL